MRLSCQKALLLLIATIACDNSTGPRTIEAGFTLKAINGRPLPTYLAETPGPSTTIYWSILSLNKNGTATMSEHRRVDPPGTEGIYVTTYDYRLKGYQIELLVHCAADANCVPNPVGMIFGSSLNLSLNPNSSFAINYEYQPGIHPIPAQ